MYTFLDGYCSTVQGLLDWFEVDLGFTELLFIQIDLCVMYYDCHVIMYCAYDVYSTYTLFTVYFDSQCACVKSLKAPCASQATLC